tara:strand:+ start:249 stop:497 length:249 start_codon:yes stop_codon:yes gene_type:complete
MTENRMSKRINELRLDAGISLLHDEPYLVAVNKSGNIEDPMIGLEKFAELIIEDIAHMCETTEFEGSMGYGGHFAELIRGMK